MPTPAVQYTSDRLAQHKAFPMSQTCANCEEFITGAPYQADGEAFCCVGCALGGPCQCTYTSTEPLTEPMIEAKPTIAEERATYLAASNAPASEQTLAWPPPAPQSTIDTVRRRPSILRVAGLTQQFDLLRLGSELEERPEIEDISLVRADLDDAWLAVTVQDTDALAAALIHLDGFEVDARPNPAGVDATVIVRPAASAEAASAVPARVPAAVEARRDEPHARPRFRIFRRPDDADVAAAADESQALPPIAPAAQTPAAPAQPPAPPVPVVAPPMPVEPAVASAPSFAAPAAPVPVVTPPSVAVGVAPEVSRPAAVTREEPPDLISADARPGGAVTMREHITLVAYPFRSFVALNEFQDAIRALRGVANVKVRRFYRGTLHLGVEYEDVLPLTERMHDLEGFAWRLVSSSQQEMELMLEEQGDLVSSG